MGGGRMCKAVITASYFVHACDATSCMHVMWPLSPRARCARRRWHRTFSGIPPRLWRIIPLLCHSPRILDSISPLDALHVALLPVFWVDAMTQEWPMEARAIVMHKGGSHRKLHTGCARCGLHTVCAHCISTHACAWHCKLHTGGVHRISTHACAWYQAPPV